MVSVGGCPSTVFYCLRDCRHSSASTGASQAGAGCLETSPSRLSHRAGHHLSFLSFQRRHRALVASAISQPLLALIQLLSPIASPHPCAPIAPASASSTHQSCPRDAIILLNVAEHRCDHLTVARLLGLLLFTCFLCFIFVVMP